MMTFVVCELSAVPFTCTGHTFKILKILKMFCKNRSYYQYYCQYLNKEESFFENPGFIIFTLFSLFSLSFSHGLQFCPRKVVCGIVLCKSDLNTSQAKIMLSSRHRIS